MAIRTPFTELFGVSHPLVLAPMGGVSGGALATVIAEQVATASVPASVASMTIKAASTAVSTR